MNIKQTVKEIVFGLILSVGVPILAVMPTYAAKCAGVETSIIGCSQAGPCNGGEDPFEGTKPQTSDEEGKYFLAHGHKYGLCKLDVAPNTTIERSGVWGLLVMAIKIMTAGVGILAVAGIVYASILYASAGGNPEQTKKAMGIITNVVIGIIAYAFMFALLNFITPGGLFN